MAVIQCYEGQHGTVIAPFGERISILAEFVALPGYHRKQVIRVLRDEVTETNVVGGSKLGLRQRLKALIRC
jgi:hypothetical protein